MKNPKKRIFRISCCLVLIPILTLLLVGSTLAESKHWIGGASDWNSAGNWSPNGVPVKGDAVLIDTQGDTVSYNNDRNPTLRSLQIDDPTGGNVDPTLRQNALTLTTEKTELGLTNGSSIYDHLGGTHRILIGSLHNHNDPEKGNLHLGVGFGSVGIYDLYNAVLSVAGHEKVGIKGEAFMNQMGGTALRDTGPTLQCAPPGNPPPTTPPPPVEPVHTIGKNLYLGAEKHIDEETGAIFPSYGQFNLDAGSLTVGGSIRVGVKGKGDFNQTDGTVTVKGNDTDDPLENGLRLSTGNESSANGRRIKTRNTPSLECNAPKNPGLIVGVHHVGQYNLTGGTLKVAFSEIIGWGEGSNGSKFVQKFGTHRVTGNFYIARHPDVTSYNSYIFEGTSLYDSQDVPPDAEKGLLDVGGFASVGHLGKGEFFQDGGSVKVRGYDPQLTNLSLRASSSSGVPSLQCTTGQRQYIGLSIGRGGIGGYYLMNGELLVSRGEAIGVFDGSDGAFIHTSGSHYIGGTLTIALVPGSTGLYELYDGLLAARSGLVNNGSFNLYGGILQAKANNNGTFLAGKSEPGKPAPAVTGDFFNRENATLTLKDTKVKFGTNFYNDGTINSANSSSLISEPIFKNLTVNETGILSLSQDKITVTGNFINKSTRPNDWQTEYADIVFSGPGMHSFKTGSKLPTAGADPFMEKNFVWSDFAIEGDARVRLQGHLIAGGIKGVIADPITNNITNMFGFCGIQIAFDPTYSQNLSGMKLFNPWGKQVGHFTADGFEQDCH